MNEAHGQGGAATAPTRARRTWAALLGRVARIPAEEASVSRRGFTVDDPAAAARLEQIGARFVRGYNLAVGSCALHELATALAGQPREEAGFAYEGAAMGLAVADWLTPGAPMFDQYLRGPAYAHEYMAWVGLGWALARLPVRPERALARYRNLHCWLALDGYGFHEGYFNWPRRIVRQRRPAGLSRDGLRVFDQGLGRSLWFVYGADGARVAQALHAFAAPRHADLWAGVGLAAAYAGGSGAWQLQALVDASGMHGAALAQGVVFAAEARCRAGNLAPHVELACGTVLGRDAASCAQLAHEARPASGCALEHYQAWRLAIQEACLAGAPRPAGLIDQEPPCPSPPHALSD